MKPVVNKLDLNLLPIALALYDERNVTRAAQRLGMSQPAVSIALRKLRGRFDDQLFVRAPNGITPTPRAHALIEVARPLVTQLFDGLLADDRFDPPSTTRPFTFALSDVGEMVFLPRLLERLRGHAPNASIRSVSVSPEETAEGLESGQIDPSFVVTHVFPLEEAPLAYELFKKKQDGCIKVVLKP